MINEDTVMTLLERSPTSYKHLITIKHLKTMLMKELIVDYTMARLMHEMLKRKEKESQGENAPW
jgi:hypothetical protein